MGNLDFTCIYSFTLDAIEKLGYDQDKIDLYRKSMLSGRRQGKLRFYISKEDYEQSIKEFDSKKILEQIGTHYREAESIAKQCEE